MSTVTQISFPKTNLLFLNFKKFNENFLFYMFEWFYEYMPGACVCHKEDVRYTRTGIIHSCRPLHSAGNQTHILWKNNQCS